MVGLITNPFIGNGLVSLVDAIAGGLFGSQDVVDAWADAGRLAKAALVGDLSSVLPEVIADLRSNSVVDAAIESTVTDAIETLFGDTGLWDALQSAVVSLVGNVLGDTSVQDAVGGKGRGVGVGSARWWALGTPSVPQVSAAVVGLITNPFIGNGLVSLVDAIAVGCSAARTWSMRGQMLPAGWPRLRWWVICRRCCRR